MASGYTSCCEVGFCGGYPANCFCDANCHSRGDCCNDIEDICPQGKYIYIFAVKVQWDLKIMGQIILSIIDLFLLGHSLPLPTAILCFMNQIYKAWL